MRHRHRVPLALLVALAALGSFTPLNAQRVESDSAPAPGTAADSAGALWRTGRDAYRENSPAGRARAIATWQEAARHYGDGGRAMEQARTLSWICLAQKELGPPAKAVESCRTALAASEAVGSVPNQATSHLHLGDLFRGLSQPDSALSHFRPAALLYHQAEDPANEGFALTRMGLVHNGAGRPDSAIAAFTAALVPSRLAHDTTTEALAHNWLGYFAQERDQDSAALEHYRAARALYAGRGPSRALRRVHRSLGGVFETLSVADSAIYYLTRALGDPPIGTPSEEARALRRIAELHARRDTPDSAVIYYRAALELVNAGADSAAKQGVLRGLAVAYHNAKQLDSAVATFRSVIQLHRAAGDSSLLSSASSWLGKVEDERGNAGAAIAAYSEAIAWYPHGAAQLPVAAMHRELAALFEKQGLPDSAASHVRAASRSNVDSVYMANRDRLAQASPHLRQVGRQLDPRQLDSAITDLRRSLKPGGDATDRALEAATLRQLADLYWSRELKDSAFAYRRAAITAYREAIGAYPPGADSSLLGEIHAAIGALFEKQGQLDSMSAHFRTSTTMGTVTPVDSAVLLFSLGVDHGLQRRLDPAISTLQEAARRFEARGSQGFRNSALSRVATLFRDKGQLDSALAYARLLVADWRRLTNPGEEAFALMLKAGFQLQRGELDSALAASTAGLNLMPPTSEPRLGAALHGIRGTAFSSTGRYDSALVHHRAAVAGWKAAGDIYKSEAARSTGHLGSIFRQLGQFDSALAYHRTQRAMNLSGTIGNLAALREIALDFEAAGRRDSALSYQRERQEAARFRREFTFSDPLGDRRAESDAFERIGVLQLEQGDTAAAQAAFASALTSYREADTTELDAESLNDLASLYDRVEEDDSALVYRRKAYERARETGAGAEETLALSVIGRLETRRGNVQAGLTALRTALDRHRAAGSLEMSAAILGNIGYTLRRLPAPDLTGALAAFDTAAGYRAAVRTQAGGDENRLSIGEQFTLPVGEWELAWLARAPESGDQPAAYSALAAAERGRAQALLDLMLGTSRQAQPGADLAAEGRRLVTAATGRGAGLLSYLVTEDTLIIWYARPRGGAGSPGVTALKVPVSADSLARLIGRWRAALGVDQADVGARLAGATEGPRLEGGLRTGAAGSAAAVGNHAEIGAILSRILLPDELRSSRAGPGSELVIVPHGALTVIPFGALSLSDSTEALGNRHALRYAPSLASLAEVERRPSAPRSTLTQRLRRALVVGDPLMPTPVNGDGETLTLAQLPAAVVEGRAVARRLGTTSLTGAAATEAAIRRRMPAAPLIHLATHGYAYADPGRARRSFVALASDSASDGLLTVGEVLDDPALKLSADLVVLSACQTGLGNLKRAEGTVGLQRAFMARGARSLLVSLWSVSDEATAILMERFYQHWLGDPDQPAKSEALRRAQADLRATRGFEEPRYWAPFLLVGAR